MNNFGTRQVGEFTPSRPIIRTPKNPIDKATIVSLYPKDINDFKPTVFPSHFHVPAGSTDDPSVTVIDPTSWFRDMGDDQPMIEIPVNAYQLATSIITDYCNGLLGCDMENSMPGMFFIAGAVDKPTVLQKYKNELLRAQLKQRTWFQTLIKLADSLWARANGNPIVIWDEMRVAAKELGYDKPWIKDFQMKAHVKCFACGFLRDPEYPVCPTCKAVDPKHPLAKELKFAQ